MQTNFWQSRTGDPLTGAPDAAFTGSFKIIPDGTIATAAIKSFTLNEYNNEEYYQITWRLLSTPYKGSEVRQKIKAFDVKPNIAQRALNMLMLIGKLCGYSPVHQNKPTTADLAVMVGKMCSIKIQEWSSEGKHGNHVSEVHPVGSIADEIGISLPVTTHTPDMMPPSALERNKRLPITGLDDEIPFN